MLLYQAYGTTMLVIMEAPTVLLSNYISPDELGHKAARKAFSPNTCGPSTPQTFNSKPYTLERS